MEQWPVFRSSMPHWRAHQRCFPRRQRSLYRALCWRVSIARHLHGRLRCKICLPNVPKPPMAEPLQPLYDSAFQRSTCKRMPHMRNATCGESCSAHAFRGPCRSTPPWPHCGVRELRIPWCETGELGGRRILGSERAITSPYQSSCDLRCPRHTEGSDSLSALDCPC